MRPGSSQGNGVGVGVKSCVGVGAGVRVTTGVSVNEGVGVHVVVTMMNCGVARGAIGSQAAISGVRTHNTKNMKRRVVYGFVMGRNKQP